MITLEDAVKIVQDLRIDEFVIAGAESKKFYAFWTVDKSITDLDEDTVLIMDIVILVSKKDGSTSGRDNMLFFLDTMDDPTYRRIDISDYVENPVLASKYWNRLNKDKK